MIVKNARLQLPATLDALQPLWEDVPFLAQAVFVDTGSEDDTVGYLQARFADREQVQIYRRDWSDDFSVARNDALTQVNRFTSSWVLVLDADEHLPPQSVELLKQWGDVLRQQEPSFWPEAVMCVRENLDDQGSVISRDYLNRLWQASPEVRYVGRVHERPVRFVSHTEARPLHGVPLSSPLYLRHQATSFAGTHAKKALYFDLLTQARLESPSPYLDYHWVISEQVQQKQSPQVRLQVLQKAMQATQQQEGKPLLPDPAWAGVPWAAAILEAQYLWVEAGNARAMISFVSRLLQEQPERVLFAESWGQLALAYVEQEQWEAALAAFYRCLNPEGRVCDPSQGWHTWRCHGFLAALYQRMGDLPAAWCHVSLAACYVLPADFKQALLHFQQRLAGLCTRSQAIHQLEQSLQRAQAAQDEVAQGWLACFLWGIQRREDVIQAVIWGDQGTSLAYFRTYLCHL